MLFNIFNRKDVMNWRPFCFRMAMCFWPISNRDKNLPGIARYPGQFMARIA
jgi:hypothetical protein